MLDRTGSTPVSRSARHRAVRLRRVRSISAPTNGYTVKLAISVVTTTDSDVAGSMALVAKPIENATQTAAAQRAKRAGNGARNQRCPGMLQ
ncbi:hypothetical protein [Paraburkholderia sp. BL21I4N1]|uniref:hypothetical protein n=1 Tax=Paraburkholderia sp. BL21I4N1 TaxID=1938801 RepID=UPI0015E3C941|nr:hypothetical protein [Paraburkholderia sp. BL21I4N1]